LLTETLAVAADDDALALGRPPTAPPAAGQASGCSRRSEGTTSEAAEMRASESQRVLHKLSVCGGICYLSISCWDVCRTAKGWCRLQSRCPCMARRFRSRRRRSSTTLVCVVIGPVFSGVETLMTRPVCIGLLVRWRGTVMIWSKLLRAEGGGSFVSGLGARLGSSPERRLWSGRGLVGAGHHQKR